jgi:hypothetical protein
MSNVLELIGNTELIAKFFIAPADPTATDDSDAGLNRGQLWLNTSSGNVFICSDDTATAAVWKQFAQITDVEANNELAEILANGNTTGGNDIVLTSGDALSTDGDGIFSPIVKLYIDRGVAGQTGGDISAQLIDGIFYIGDRDSNNGFRTTAIEATFFVSSTRYTEFRMNTNFYSRFTSNHTANREYILPDASGTIALTSDLNTIPNLAETVNLNFTLPIATNPIPTGWVTGGFYIFAGTGAKTITKIEVAAQAAPPAGPQAITDYDIRVIDVTNGGAVIATITAIAATGGDVIYDLGTISNLPATGAVFEIQTQVNAGGISGVVNLRAAKFTF